MIGETRVRRRIIRTHLENQTMKRFRLVWLSGEVETVEGRTIADAFKRAGYGSGAIRALDYYVPLRD